VQPSVDDDAGTEPLTPLDGQQCAGAATSGRNGQCGQVGVVVEHDRAVEQAADVLDQVDRGPARHTRDQLDPAGVLVHDARAGGDRGRDVLGRYSGLRERLGDHLADDSEQLLGCPSGSGAPYQGELAAGQVGDAHGHAVWADIQAEHRGRTAAERDADGRAAQRAVGGVRTVLLQPAGVQQFVDGLRHGRSGQTGPFDQFGDAQRCGRGSTYRIQNRGDVDPPQHRRTAAADRSLAHVRPLACHSPSIDSERS
jgi:hypothetical protein